MELTNKRGEKVGLPPARLPLCICLAVASGWCVGAGLREGEGRQADAGRARLEQSTKTADKFIIATGGRPKYLDIPNDREVPSVELSRSCLVAF